MKKQIDPNLNNNSGCDLILGDGLEPKSVSNAVSNAADDIASILMSNGHTPKKNDGEFEIRAKTQEELSREHHHHHHHHHSSSGHSHHHSSGSHHHSSGEHSHHHSSHHSSGSHHHHHSGSHHHHHHSDEKKKKMPKIVKILLIILAILLLIVFIVGATFLVLRSQGAKSIKPTVTDNTSYEDVIEYKGQKYKYNKDIVTIAFLGVDQESLKSDKNSDFVGCSDADILITVDTVDGTAKVIAVPRDTMVDVDQYNSKGEFVKTGNVQLCLAYAYGDGREKSCNNVIGAMSRILYNVPIEKYYCLDLAGVAPLNDAIGGVIVDSIYDLPEFGIKSGQTVRLMGDAARAYVQTRDMDKITASLNRTDRQVQYVNAYAKQVVPAVLNKFSVVSELYNIAGSYSQTNLSLSDATYLASLLLSKGVTTFDTYTITGEMKAVDTTDYPDSVHAEFYPDEDSIMDTVVDVFYEPIQ